MKILASIRQGDVADAHLVLLECEKVEEDSGFGSAMYLGIESDNGDDTIFAFLPSEEEVIADMEARWGHWETFQYNEDDK